MPAQAWRSHGLSISATGMAARHGLTSSGPAALPPAADSAAPPASRPSKRRRLGLNGALIARPAGPRRPAKFQFWPFFRADRSILYRTRSYRLSQPLQRHVIDLAGTEQRQRLDAMDLAWHGQFRHADFARLGGQQFAGQLAIGGEQHQRLALGRVRLTGGGVREGRRGR